MRRTSLALLLVLAGVFGLGAALAQAGPGRLPSWLTELGSGNQDEAAPPSRPVRLAIPALDVAARVRPVGLDEHGAIGAPPLRRAHEVGWYEEGPTPGQYGAAVLVGHVDDTRGPAVFHQLATVAPGTRIEVIRRDRSVAAFQVTEVVAYDKLALPPDEVYGDFTAAELRLITCGGRWVGGELGYADNIVVFATLIP